MKDSNFDPNFKAIQDPANKADTILEEYSECQGIYYSKKGLANLAKAMAKAQGNIKAAIKDEANPYFKSSYATLASVYNACREELSKNGIAVFQHAHNRESAVIVTTRIIHGESGEWMQSSIYGRPTKPDIQSIGSVITYLRRYSLSTIVGVPADDDDSATAVNGNNIPEPKITKEQVAVLEDLYQQNLIYRQSVLEALKIQDFTQLPQRHFERALNAIKTKRNNMKKNTKNNE
ncbi:MAG: ERF family protein [Candidatus Thorarchaeota archaeon]